ncbi:replication-relaxation family protein, partial [Candidatus Saccharibacteria bacterium]|nr:replication-relaxation family protein [Candidatus Saccharibacteria bacterium]
KWQYDLNDFISKSKPAIYYLSLNGIRHLKSLDRYPNTELKKRYKDGTRSESFINQSILIADCCITLESSNTEHIIYNYVLEADYLDPNSTYHYLNDLGPSLYFTKTIKDKNSNDDTAVQYLLEIFNETTPRYKVKRKLEMYIELVEEDETNQQIVLLAFPSVSELLYAKRRVKLLSENLDEDTTSKIRFATTDKIKQVGVAGEIWEEV